VEAIREVLERIRPNQPIPPSLPDSGRPSGSTNRSRPERPDEGCICDGTGWLETWREDSLGGKWVMVRCEACYALRYQASLVAQSGLLPSELAISLDDVIVNGPDTAIMLAMAREFCRLPWGIWTLWGTYGNAKTMILQAVVNHFRGLGVAAVYVRFKDLLDHIRAGNAPDAADDAIARYRRLIEIRFLSIDEVDKTRLTEYADEFRASFLDDRWRYGIERNPGIQRHTLLAMNDDPAGLPGHIYDRLRDGRFGCWLDDVWHPGITRNRDPSMRPALERAR
jgi:hypothetical protein